jgi:hypothetical protein
MSSLPLSYWSPGGSYMTPSPMANVLFLQSSGLELRVLSTFAIWATAHNLRKRCGPHGRIRLGSVGHCTDSGSHTIGHSAIPALNWIRIGSHVNPVVMFSHAFDCVSTCTWPYIHVNMYPHKSGHVFMSWIWFCAMCMSPCIHIHITVYPYAHVLVSTYMWPCIQVHVAMYPHGHISICTWLYINMQKLFMRYGHSIEFI